ncbi:MAG TPA: hypothetical protein VE956_07730 [Nodularia sp. (in: cyanobacteria)]|nr:hypothetical protein [Nodularia sp. (in: cyanobacteria)]
MDVKFCDRTGDLVADPPTTVYSYNLEPKLGEKIQAAFFSFNWQGTQLKKEFSKHKQEKFLPVTYKKKWEIVRKIDETIGVKYQLDGEKEERRPKVVKHPISPILFHTRSCSSASSLLPIQNVPKIAMLKVETRYCANHARAYYQPDNHSLPFDSCSRSRSN